MMKYAVNHHWKFRRWHEAYLIGFFQAFVLILCESVNLIILTTNHSMLDIIMNFLAIIVITEFDDAFFFIVQQFELASLLTDGEFEHESKQGEKWTVECKDILKIECTTSNYAKMRVPGNKLRRAKMEENAAIVDPTAVKAEESSDEERSRQVIDGEPDYILIKQRERTCCNWLARVFYRIFKTFFASIWFYFVPFYCIVLSFQIPVYHAA